MTEKHYPDFYHDKDGEQQVMCECGGDWPCENFIPGEVKDLTPQKAFYDLNLETAFQKIKHIPRRADIDRFIDDLKKRFYRHYGWS